MPHTITVDEYVLDFGKIKNGAYTLKVAMIAENKAIKLAVDENSVDENGYFELCKIEIK